MRHLLTLVGTVMFVLGVVLSVVAQDVTEEKPFTKDELKRFLADWPAFVSWAENKGEQYNNLETPGAGRRWSREMEEYLAGKGWQPERFFYVLSHVTYGMLVVQMQQVPEITSQLKEQMVAVENDPNLPEAQKQMLLSQMGQAVAQTAQLGQHGKDLPYQELELIKANKEELLAVIEQKKE